MPPAPVPYNEQERLATLGECRLLDTPAEPDFDDLTALAAQVCNAPIALISLIDADRQWFKSKVGLSLAEAPRDIAVCAYAILSDKPLVIPDTTQDVRTQDNPLVVGEPHVRFYAGIPLKIENSLIGTLCVVDFKARTLTEEQLAAVQRIARRVTSHIEMRREAALHRRTADALARTRLGFSRAALALFFAALTATALSTVLTFPSAHAAAGAWRPAIIVAATGTLRATVLGLFVWYFGRSRTRALAAAEVMTADLQEAKAHAEQVTAELRTQSIALQNQRERLELALSTGGLGTWEWNLAADTFTFDARWAAIFGEESLPTDTNDLIERIHPDDLPAVKTALYAHFEGRQQIFDSLRRHRHNDGSWRWTHVRGVVVARDENGKPLRMVGITEDITRQKEIEDAASAANNLIRRTGSMANIGGWEHDLVNGTALWSDEIYAMHDLTIGTPMTPESALVFYPDDARAVINEARRKTIETGEPWDLELPRYTATGRLMWIRSQGECIYDDKGRPVKLWGAVQDITDRKRAQEQLHHAATHDKLTGLPNRALLVDRLQQCIQRAYRSSARPFAVLFLDFDRFKFVNDTLGHSAGDELLRQISARLRNVLRPADTVGISADNFSTVSRLGGDEFVVILDEIQDRDDALLVAERLLGVLAQPYTLGDVETVSTASIGIVTSSPEYTTADQMLRDADIAMYEAKNTGKGRCVLFNMAMHDRVQGRVDTEADLRTALQRDQFSLVYQPIVAIDSGVTHSMEALIRWNHPTRGLVAPTEFIAIAEETGLIVPIGEWVLRTACKQFVVWRNAFGERAPSTISVNLSRKQLARHDLLETVRAALADAGMEPSALHLEITESTVMSDPAAAKRTLNGLRAIGVKIDLDDFGTGHSSLASLHQYPIDVLKMDRAFIANMQRGQKFSALIQAIIQLAGNLDMQVVAEGIETGEQLITLQSMDCQLGQGYLFSKPLAPEQVGDYLERSAQWSDENFAPLLVGIDR